MNRPQSILLVLLLFSCAAFAQEQKDEVQKYLTPENKAKLEKGETVHFKRTAEDGEGKSSGQGAAMCLVNASPQDTWKYLRDYTKHTEFFPRLTEVKKYSEDGNKLGLECTLKVAFKKVHYFIIQTWDDASHTMTWVLDKTQKNDIADTSGIWQLLPYGDDKTLIFYSMSTDTGMFVPKTIQNYLMNRDLPSVVEALKKRTQSGGKWIR